MSKIVQTTLASAVAQNGTFTVAYPDGTNSGYFTGGWRHKLSALGALREAPSGLTVSFGSSNITVTYKGATTLPAGTQVYLEFDTVDEDRPTAEPVAKVAEVTPYIVSLGAPITADTDNMVKAATSTELPNTETVTYTPDTDGTSPTDGVGPVVTVAGVLYWSMDVPRNVSAVVTHGSSIVAMTIVVTGLDEYLQTVKETLTITATGTSKTAAGLKAFKYVRSLAITAAADAEANTANIGFGDVLGLPVFLPEKGFVTKEIEDGAAATAGTLLAGVTSAATATTGDVRGTYDPNSACDGSKSFQLIAMIPDPTFKGVTQYSG